MDYKLQDHLDLVRDSHRGLNAKVTRWKDKTLRKMKRMKERHKRDCDELMDRILRLEMKMEEDTESAEGDMNGNRGSRREDRQSEEEEVDWGELEYENENSDESGASNSDQSVY